MVRLRRAGWACLAFALGSTRGSGFFKRVDVFESCLGGPFPVSRKTGSRCGSNHGLGGMRDANNARCQMMVMGEGVRGAFEGKSLSGRLPHAQLHCPFCPLAFVIMRCSFCPFVIADKPRVAVQREAVQRHKFSGIPDCVPRKCHGNSRS